MPVSNPYGNDPYGNPAGQNPYGSPSPYGDGAAAAKTDGVSIASFVLSLLCCTGIVGVILGFVGLSRTKGGQRKGRWAAIAGIIIGLLATIGLAVGGVLIYVVAESQVSIPDAKVGQCLNVDEGSDDTVFLTKKECDEDHDGEIVYKGEYAEIKDAPFTPSDPDDLTDTGISLANCSAVMDPADVEKLTQRELDWSVVLEEDAVSDPADDDTFICIVWSDDKLDEPLL